MYCIAVGLYFGYNFQNMESIFDFNLDPDILRLLSDITSTSEFNDIQCQMTVKNSGQDVEVQKDTQLLKLPVGGRGDHVSHVPPVPVGGRGDPVIVGDLEKDVPPHCTEVQPILGHCPTVLKSKHKKTTVYVIKNPVLIRPESNANYSTPNDNIATICEPVSYTHLTLPTKA